MVCVEKFVDLGKTKFRICQNNRKYEGDKFRARRTSNATAHLMPRYKGLKI